MQLDFQIGLVTSYGGYPLDITLPVLGEAEFMRKRETAGHCFHIYSLAYTNLLLFSKTEGGLRRTAGLDIRSSCKENSDVSLSIVRMDDGRLFLRAYIDREHNGLYPLPHRLTEQYGK